MYKTRMAVSSSRPPMVWIDNNRDSYHSTTTATTTPLPMEYYSGNSDGRDIAPDLLPPKKQRNGFSWCTTLFCPPVKTLEDEIEEQCIPLYQERFRTRPPQRSRVVSSHLQGRPPLRSSTVGSNFYSTKTELQKVPLIKASSCGESSACSQSSRHRRGSALSSSSLECLFHEQAAGQETTDHTTADDTEEEEPSVVAFPTFKDYLSPLDSEDEQSFHGRHPLDTPRMRNSKKVLFEDDLQQSLKQSQGRSRVAFDRRRKKKQASISSSGSGSCFSNSSSSLWELPSTESCSSTFMSQEDEEDSVCHPQQVERVYLPKSISLENRFLHEQQQQDIVVSGWVAFSHGNNSIVEKLLRGNIEQNDLVYIILKSRCKTLWWFDSSETLYSTTLRGRVESQLISGQLGHYVSLPETCTMFVPVGLDASGRYCPRSRGGGAYAPIQQHEAVMHIRFALDSLIRS